MTRVFVYGTLRQGQGNHRLLENQQFIGTSRTEAIYEMIHLGGFPGVLRTGPASIRGEIYEVDDDALARLDRLEGHPHFYTREEIDIPGTERVWIYFYNNRNPSRENIVIESGDWNTVNNENRVEEIAWGG